MEKMAILEGSVDAPSGFHAAGLCAGLKRNDLDLALLFSDKPSTVAGVFTSNAVRAAPVLLCEQVVERGVAQALIVNSGCANACTGKHGMEAAHAVVGALADRLGINPSCVMMCSTGTIGKPLAVDRIIASLDEAVDALGEGQGGLRAARAIMTTDTVEKTAAVTCRLGGNVIRLGGMAKGSGMIAPNMATMLAFITTDANVEPKALQDAVRQVADVTFNRITVDGDQSTNDSFIVMANGMAMVDAAALDAAHEDWPIFMEALETLARDLARKIVLDGEGATRLVTVTVKGAATQEDATKVAKSIANSLLCKTAWHGGDPNWGRILCAAGYSGADVDGELVDISFDELQAVRGGQIVPEVTMASLEDVFSRKEFTVMLNLNRGTGQDSVLTCDCSEEYVKINSEYMT